MLLLWFISFFTHYAAADSDSVTDCGHFGSTPLNKCTLISSSLIDDQPSAMSHRYECSNDIYTERVYSTTHCAGDSTVKNITDICTDNDNYCSCAESECAVHTDVYSEDCLNAGGDMMYAAKDHVMNVCIAKIGMGSEKYTCPTVKGGEPTHEEWDDSYCACKESEITANPKCIASHDYDVPCDPHYFQYPINECVQIIRDPSLQSVKYTCNKTQGNTSYFKHIYDGQGCGGDSVQVEQLFECDKHPSSACSCSANTEECDSFLSVTYVNCYDKTMERVMPSVCVPSDMVDMSDNEEHDTWVQYNCNSDGYTTLDIYYDEACTKKEKECPLEYVIDCDYQMDGKNDDKCGYILDERAATIPMDFCYKNEELYDEFWRKATCDGNGEFYIKKYTEYPCAEDTFVELLYYTDACAEYEAITPSSCACGKGASCHVATQAPCDDPTHPTYAFVVDQCVFGNVGSMSNQCDEEKGRIISYFSDYQCKKPCADEAISTCIEANDANTTLCAHYRGKPLGFCMLDEAADGSYDLTYSKGKFYKRVYEKEDCTGNKTASVLDECDPAARECFAPDDYKDGDETNCNVVKEEYCGMTLFGKIQNASYTVTDICILQDGFVNFPVKYSCKNGQVSKDYTACTNCVYTASHLISDPELCVFSNITSTEVPLITPSPTTVTTKTTGGNTKKSTKKSNTTAAAIIVVVVVVVVLVAAFFYLNKRYNWIKAGGEAKEENYATLLDQKDNRL